MGKNYIFFVNIKGQDYSSWRILYELEDEVRMGSKNYMLLFYLKLI